MELGFGKEKSLFGTLQSRVHAVTQYAFNFFVTKVKLELLAMLSMTYIDEILVIIRIPELRDFGLLDFWAKRFQPDLRQCLDEAGKIMQPKKSTGRKDSLSRLSIKNLTGAFVVLAVGYLVSFLVFLAEKIVSLKKK